MEHKNFLLAMGLIVSFLLLWSVFVVPRLTPPQAPTAPVATGPADTGMPAGSPEKLPPTRVSKEAAPVFSDTVLRDENNEIVLSPKGGAVRSWLLRSKGQDVDMVLYPEVEPRPLASFPDTPFKIVAGDRQAVMTATLPNGLRVTKTLRLSIEGHLHQISFHFQNPTAQPIELSKWDWGWGPGVGTAPTEMKENARLVRAITLGKLKVHVLKESASAEFGRWAAIDNRYYLVAFVPRTAHPVDLSVTGAKDQTHLHLLETTSVPARGEAVVDYDLYVGPKGYAQLKKYGKGLEAAVDFGTFTALGHLILRILIKLHAMTGNYGLSIILLTMGIQLCMSPLTIKSFKATLAMKKLQPKIADIQARFKNDPKRLNVEMMNVYKTSGTNPFGGCLPMLLQLPIFWALFTTLRNAYELRGAPFAGWIHDLSTPDILLHAGGFPVHALPLIMGGAMFFQQKMSGAASDPTQKQMMTMMPIMFTFMFYSFPSGLVLYWLTNNLMTMAFQWGFQRFSQSPPPNVVNTTIVK